MIEKSMQRSYQACTYIIKLQVTQENELNTQNINMNAQVPNDVINKNIVVQHQVKIP